MPKNRKDKQRDQIGFYLDLIYLMSLAGLAVAASIAIRGCWSLAYSAEPRLTFVTSDYSQRSHKFEQDWQREKWPLSRLRNSIESNYAVRWIGEYDAANFQRYPVAFVSGHGPIEIDCGASGSGILHIGRILSESRRKQGLHGFRLTYPDGNHYGGWMPPEYKGKLIYSYDPVVVSYRRIMIGQAVPAVAVPPDGFYSGVTIQSSDD